MSTPMTSVKICGLTRLEDAELAQDLGAFALGFVFYEKSPRFIEPAKAKRIISLLRPGIHTVGVFVNASANTINQVAQQSGITRVQLHGDETPSLARSISLPIWRGFRTTSLEEVQAWAPYAECLLIDAHNTGEAYGGTGKLSDWSFALRAKALGRVFLSGGLNPENVKQAIQTVDPDGIDVSSGVESNPGIKDHAKLQMFFKAVANG